jgi:hypothetical protein
MSSITEEQLKTLNELLAKKERTLLVIGDLEAQKHVQLHGLGDIEKEFNEFTSELSKEYGDVNIDVKTGEITPRDDKNQAVSE